jgi:thymidylate synthase ThyX
MTHRVFSRNASSSRAIPVKRLIQQVREDPYIPERFGKNQPGMQSTQDLSEDDQREARLAWQEALEQACQHAEGLANIGVHKQYVNRILEPFSHITVLVSSTSYDNWYWLRRHQDAMPEIHELSDKMYNTQTNAAPRFIGFGEWHLPFITRNDRVNRSFVELLQVSTARCARVSYQSHDGKETSFEQDKALYERLMEQQPLHASPAEHQATPDRRLGFDWERSHQHGNFHGWIQHRKTLIGENCINYEQGVTFP